MRLAILRAGMPVEAAIFPGDTDPDTQHFGAFEGDANKLVGVASIYRAALPEQPGLAGSWQLRGMATEVRGHGYGRALVHACIASAKEAGGTLLWCNARSSATAFYAKQGWNLLGSEFDIPTAGPHFRMIIPLRSSGAEDMP